MPSATLRSRLCSETRLQSSLISISSCKIRLQQKIHCFVIGLCVCCEDAHVRKTAKQEQDVNDVIPMFEMRVWLRERGNSLHLGGICNSKGKRGV